MRKILILFVILLSFNKAEAQLNAQFSVSVNRGCVPLLVQFTNQSTGNIVSYNWQFGNANGSVFQNPSAIYYRAGNFSVVLTVTDAQGNIDTARYDFIRVFNNPKAAFTSDTVGCISDLLNFRDISTKGDTNITQWQWDMGDGNIVRTQNPSHSYGFSNYYTIGLSITDANGCKNTTIKNRHIRIIPSAKPSFTLSKTFHCSAPLTVTTNNRSTNANSYFWTTSDGATYNTTNITHTFTTFGDHTITLNAINGKCTAKLTGKVTIKKLDPKFDLPSYLCEGQELEIENKTTTQLPENQYFWEFGDGTNSTDKNVKKTYNSPGNYTIKLTVSNGTCVETISKNIEIKEKPQANIYPVNPIGCKVPHIVDFRISGSNYKTSSWDFGDGNSHSYTNPINSHKHTYRKIGEFQPKITVISEFGCAVIYKTDPIKIGTQKVEIIPGGIDGCEKDSFLLSYAKEDFEKSIKVKWFFSDTNIIFNDKDSIKRTYPKYGNFYVFLRVLTENGCWVSDSILVNIGIKLDPKFNIKNYDICNKTLLLYDDYTDYSILPKTHKLVKKNLNSQDENLKIEQNIAKADFDKGGLHLIDFIVNHNGCKSKSKIPDSVFIHGPFVKIKAEMLPCKKFEARIEAKSTWNYRRFLIIDEDTFNTKDTQFIFRKTNNNKGKISLLAFNDTFNCYDRVDTTLFQENKFPIFSEIRKNQCIPIDVEFRETSGTYDSMFWKFENEEIIKKNPVLKTFKIPKYYDYLTFGKFEFKDSVDGEEITRYCLDTFKQRILIEGEIVRTRITHNGNCLPIYLTLQDTTFTNGATNRVWQVNGVEYPISSFQTNITIENLPPTDTSLVIKHFVIGSKCVSTTDYSIPINSPVIKNEVNRNNTCDTPYFHFEPKFESKNLPLTYLWEFEDGRTFTTKEVLLMRFKKMGFVKYKLTVTDNKGCKRVYVDSVENSPNMMLPDFTATPTGRFCPPLLAKFSDKSRIFRVGADIVEWHWDFGDGTGSRLKNPEKLYLVPGNYDITLTVISNTGCTATIKKPGYIIVNGPKGNYFFQRKDDCYPVEIEFFSNKESHATMEWDLGDGEIEYLENFKYIYNRPGRFIPALILKDTLGCKYTLPPIDTIYVYDYPKIDIKTLGLCLRDSVKIIETSKSNDINPKLKYTWTLNNQNLTTTNSLKSIKTNKQGINQLKVVAENIGKCKDTSEVYFKMYQPLADFVRFDPTVCLGSNFKFTNKSFSDTGILEYKWILSDGTITNQKDFEHRFTTPNEYDVQLIVVDKIGCVDTLSVKNFVKIGDTIPPPVLPIRRASVLSNNTTELCFSKLQSYDFKYYSIYRWMNGNYIKIAQINNIEDTLFTDKFLNTLNNSYCYKYTTTNLCYYTSELNQSKNHCTIETKAEGKEEHNLVNWSPYIGFDSIQKYEVWRRENKSNLPYEKVGETPSNQLNFTDSIMRCYVKMDYQVKAIEQDGFNEYSNSDTAQAKPFYNNKTKANETWRATVENNNHIKIEWLNNAQSPRGISHYLLSKADNKNRTYFSDKLFNPNDTIFEDFQTKVNNLSYIYQVKAVDNCLDTSPVSNISQTILLEAKFNQQFQKPEIYWNAYQLWFQGIDYYEIQRKDLSGNFVSIGTVKPSELNFIDKNAPNNCHPYYVYRVIAHSLPYKGVSEVLSVSNEVQAFPYSTLFVPNAFSPDKNNINETFGPNGQFIVKYHFQIFNRWGEKMFETNDCMQHWDGKYENETCAQEIYLYQIWALGADRKHYQLNGTFHLLR